MINGEALLNVDKLLNQLLLQNDRVFSRDDVSQWLGEGKLTACVAIPLLEKFNSSLAFYTSESISAPRNIRPDHDMCIDGHSESELSDFSDALASECNYDNQYVFELGREKFYNYCDVSSCYLVNHLKVRNHLGLSVGFPDSNQDYISLVLGSVAWHDEGYTRLRINPLTLRLTFDSTDPYRIDTLHKMVNLQILFLDREVEKFIETVLPELRLPAKGKTEARREAQYLIYEEWLEQKNLTSWKEIKIQRIKVWEQLRGMNNNLFAELRTSLDAEMKDFFSYVRKTEN